IRRPRAPRVRFLQLAVRSLSLLILASPGASFVLRLLALVIPRLAPGPFFFAWHVFLQLAGTDLGRFARLDGSRALGVPHGLGARQRCMMSASVAVWPGLSVTKALGRSPHCSSGMATTAHSSTAG